MKKIIMFVSIIAFLPFLSGMSALQGQNPEKIPLPAKKFTATFIDQADVITDCRDASIEGETFVEGKRGEGVSTVSFDNIQEISFRIEGEKLYGDVKFNDGNKVELLLKKTQTAYGHTRYGTFSIKLSDLKRVILKKAK